MKKVLIYFAALAMFTACSTDIEFTDPDNKTDEIVFSVAGIDMPASESKTASRAEEHNHIAWDDAKHANTLGVFGYCDGVLNSEHEIFKNQKVTYATDKWIYEPAKYWPEFSTASSFDFFGYMVENAASMPTASVTSSGSKYTLTFEASIDKPVLTSPDNTPLICHAPEHVTVVGMPIPFQMDQTLTGYDIQFQLDKKMDDIRYFVIKAVKIYGEDLPVGGTVSRTYTLTDGNWTAAPVTWENVTKATVPTGSPVEIASDWVINDKTAPGYAANLAARTVNTHTEWVKWGAEGLGNGAFFAIPHASFTPIIEVTYDVYTDIDGNGDGNYTLDRKDVKSTIVLNKDNFEALKSGTGTTGEIQHINIKIVPDYLYVLSDDDQTTGFLIAN